MSKVLVVDRDKHTLKMVNVMLSLEGCEVLTTSCQEDVKKLLDSESPDIVLVDDSLPGMDDFAFISEIAGLKKNINIIVTSTSGNSLLVPEMLSKGVSDCLVKPFKKDELVRSVKSLLYARQTISAKEEKPKVLLAAVKTKDLDMLRRETGELYDIETIPLRRAGSYISKNSVAVFLADISGSSNKEFIELINKLNIISPNTEVIIVDDNPDVSMVKNFIRAGAYDCISKPYDGVDIRNAVSEVLEKSKRKSIVTLKQRFEKEIIKSKEQLEHIMAVVESLISALEARDRYTKGHSERVTDLAVGLGKKMGLDKSSLERLRHASRLHDIGKIGIDDAILRKPGRLTEDERDIIMEHPVVGENILKPIKSMSHLLAGIRHHHERYDGKGYPDHLKEDKIPLEARIISIADTYDAMMSTRPYRKQMKKEDVLEELKKESGHQFDPDAVEIFLDIAEKTEIL